MPTKTETKRPTDLHTTAELADALRITERTLRELTKEIPHYRIGGSIRFRLSEVLAHFARRPRQP